MINNDLKYPPPLNLDTIVYAEIDSETCDEYEFDVDAGDELSDNGLTDYE